MNERVIFLDTETTGLYVEKGDRILEVAAVEYENRRPTGRRFHSYINPETGVHPDAEKIHGIRYEDVQFAPLFRDVQSSLLSFIKGTTVVIHNASFDVAFLNRELDPDRIEEHCEVVDTLKIAQSKHPGQRNNLDALCKRYRVDNTNRELHGALIDSELLARVYLAMTGGQEKIDLEEKQEDGIVRWVRPPGFKLVVIKANEEEMAAHNALMAKVRLKKDPVY